MVPRHPARLGDRSHPSGTPLVTASANVLIENRRAAREGDIGQARWMAVGGADHVLINGRRCHRTMDPHSNCCQVEGGKHTIVSTQSPSAEKRSVPTIDTTIEVHFRAFIPNTLDFPDKPWFDGPIIDQTGSAGGLKIQFKGDDRGFFEDGTSRLESSLTVTVKASKVAAASGSGSIGVTHRRALAYGKEAYMMDQASAKDFGNRQSQSIRERDTTDRAVHGVFEASVGMPFHKVLAPNIDYHLDVWLLLLSASRAKLLFSGSHNAFPGYELYVVHNGVRENLWFYDPAPKPPDGARGHQIGVTGVFGNETGPGLINLNWREPISVPGASTECRRSNMGSRSPLSCYFAHEFSLP